MSLDTQIRRFIYGIYGLVDDGLPIPLKELKSISNEDVIEVAKLLWSDPLQHTLENGKYYVDRILSLEDEYHEILGVVSIKIYQALISFGYAMPYLNHSVQDLCDLGVYRLISE